MKQARIATVSHPSAAIALAAALCRCGAAATAPQPASIGEGAGAEELQAIQAQVEGTMDAFAEMDLARFTNGLAEDVLGFEFDMDGAPLRLGSRDDASHFAETTFAQLAEMGAGVTLDIHSSTCDAAGAVAWCVVEFDFTATLPDGTSMTQPTRNTVVLRRTDDGWVWTHWHSSVSARP